MIEEKKLTAEAVAVLLSRAGWALAVRQLPAEQGRVWLVVLRRRNAPLTGRDTVVVGAAGADEAFRRAYRAARVAEGRADIPLPASSVC